MNLEKYKELTGIKISSSQESAVKAQIMRTGIMLESLLGFTLNPLETNKNFYNEAGKSKTDYSCANVNENNLLPPDEVVYGYRMYRFNKNDKYLYVDPFTSLEAVKLVFVKQGEDSNGVTIKTFNDSEVRLQVGRHGISRFIENCKDCECNCACTDCIQLAVDADWVDGSNAPSDLLLVWADLITGQLNFNGKNGIKSETITSHSVTYTDKQDVGGTGLNMSKYQYDILLSYAGPLGSIVETR